ncbi:MAG: cytidine deaminase [Crocinitomicaceae bacterium]|nr:cytidine deaminase [Crocinitomicaceae bacterium]
MIRRIERTFWLEEWSVSELEASDRDLLHVAFQACKTAYSPYSKFSVGTAVLLASGAIVMGSNQENAAYPSGLCAERVAFFAAGAQHPNDVIVAAAVVTDSPMPVLHFSPCGGCRQVMLETEHRQGKSIRFLMQTGESNVLVSDSVSQFLPLSFKLPDSRNL